MYQVDIHKEESSARINININKLREKSKK